MSSAGLPANDDFVASRFQAGRGAAASGIDPEIQALAEGGGGTQTAAPKGQPSPTGATPSSAGPSQPDLPIGLRLGQSAAQQMQARIAANAKLTPGSAFMGAMSGAWGALTKDFATWHQEATGALPDLLTLGGLKQQFVHDVHAGKTVVDAFNLAVSPITGAVSAAATAADKGVHKIAPFVPSGATKDMIDQGMLGLGPEGGTAAEAGLTRDAGSIPRAAALPKDDITFQPKPGSKAPAAAGGFQRQAPPAKGAAAGGAAGVSGEGLTPKADVAPFRLAADVDTPGKALKVTPEVRAQAVDFLAGKRADNPIQVSLENLSADPDLNQTVGDLARVIPKGKVKPDDIRDMNAYSLNLQPDELLERLLPQYPSDELQGAAGMLVNSTGTEFQKFAKAAMADPTPENQEMAVRAFAQANKVIGAFADSGTDLGRGLRARQATMGTRDDFQKAIQQVIADVGPENVDEAIRKVAALPDPRQVAPFVATMRKMGGRDSLLYGWYNWLLSNPATVVKKLASDAGVAGWNTAVRFAAEKFGSGDVRPGETAALITGYTGSMRDGLSAAVKALKAGHSQFYGDYQTLDGRIIESTANHQGAPGAIDQISNPAAQYLRAALPTSWIGAADDFAKVVNYRAEARALAYRDGVIKNLSGDALGNHVAATLNNMPDHLHIQAVNGALRNTFQEPLAGIAEKLQDIVDKINIPVPGLPEGLPLGRVIMPFVKVPANIAKFAYSNSPLAALLPSARIRAELAAGGATRDMAQARMGLGTAVSMIAAPFILGGGLTGRGPSDPQINRAWQAAGNKPYSINVGGTWYGYNRIEPIGMHLGALADTIETIKYAHDADAEQLAWSAAFGIGDAMLSKTYMQGMSDFLNALHDPQGEGKYFGDKLAASMALPQGAAALAAASDPWLRQHYSLVSAVQARAPGLASNLPPVRDLWGQPVPHDQGFAPPLSGTTMGNLLSPVSMGPAGNAQPIDKWIWDNRAAFPQSDNGRLGLTRPGQVQTFSNGRLSVPKRLTEQQLDRLRELTGNALKDPRTGLGARDALNALVDGNYPQGPQQSQWDKASPAARALIVLRVWNRYRDGAKQQLLAENPDMQGAVREQLSSRLDALKAPTLGEGQ